MSLFLRDFDAEDAQCATASSVAAPSEALPRFTAEEVERLLVDARETAFAQGHAEGDAAARAEVEAGLSARTAQALEVVQAGVGDLLARDALRRAELERDVLDLLLDVGERIAPEFLTAYSADLALSRIREGLRMAGASARLTIRLSPAIADAIGTRVAELGQAAEARPEVVSDAALKDGEARLSWDKGAMSYSLEHVCAAVLDALREAAAKLKDDQEKVG